MIEGVRREGTGGHTRKAAGFWGLSSYDGKKGAELPCGRHETGVRKKLEVGAR